MNWEPISPRPRDFCGHPPCPKCFRPVGGGRPPIAAPSGFAQFALELLGRAPATKAEERKVKKIADDMHANGVGAPKEPSEKPPRGEADIGMTATRLFRGRMKQLRPGQVAAVRALTCDEIADRQARRAAEVGTKRKEQEERLAPIREAAEVFAAVQANQERKRAVDENVLRDVDPSFVEEFRRRGCSPTQIRYEWARYQGARGYVSEYSDFDNSVRKIVPRGGY